MRILIINPILFSGDGNKLPKVDTIKDTMIYNMCLGFQSLGHNITLLAIDDYKPTENEVYDFEILFFKNNLAKILPSPLPFSIEMYLFLKKNASQFDMILSSEIFGFHSLFAAIVAPSKTIIWHELVAHQKKWFTVPSRLWHSVIVPLFFRHIRIVIGRSDNAITFISQYIPKDKISKVPIDHGINIHKFQLSDYKARQFITIGQLIYRKNINSIIYKFHRFISQKEYSDFILLIAGRGPLKNELQKLVSDLDINKNVVFLGFLSHEQLNKYLSESYASLIDTRNDLNMVSIPEAIVSGTPILTNTIPALANYINKNKLGIAKEQWDHKDLEQIVKDNTYKNNCLKIRNTLSTENVANKIIKIFIESAISK
ncbi:MULTISPECIES: glycosyltransferase family 4 protein [Bacteroides]|uniref:glycosyltransferase family 4 protein n=1 Tax=Bacteroides TaxID=816 RepID=UPI001EDEEE95|nr:glycosyltransferase family 4 protein [Bacteroides nordii]MCG4770237.1 glycosyltransferase family 4 protein [Bacteroides nordii]